jgi:hypothetical protein
VAFTAISGNNFIFQKEAIHISPQHQEGKGFILLKFWVANMTKNDTVKLMRLLLS